MKHEELMNEVKKAYVEYLDKATPSALYNENVDFSSFVAGYTTCMHLRKNTADCTTVKEKALNRVRELLKHDDLNIDNISISCGRRFEISKIIDLDSDSKVILYSVKNIDEKFRELSDLIHLVWQIELTERDVEKILNKNSQ
jgi:hypothetical protein